MGKIKSGKKLVLGKETLKNLKPKPGSKNAGDAVRPVADDEAAAIKGGPSGNTCNMGI